MAKSPAYLAGYEAARVPDASLIRAIDPPATYTTAEASDYVSGFLLGSRDSWNADLIDEWIAEDAAESVDERGV